MYLVNGYYIRYTKNSKVRNKKTNILSEKCQRLADTSPRRYVEANKHLKKIFHIICHKEIKIKAIRYHYTCIRMAKFQNTDNMKNQ